MIRIVEVTCSLSKSRSDQLMVTDTEPFRLLQVIALDSKKPENPFGQDVASMSARPIAGGAEGARLFGLLLPPPAENARAAFYEIRWERAGVEGGVVFEIDR